MDRHFTEDEAREVFARAAERQHAVGARGAGLSLDELRAIGAEAGLDPEHVEAAARSVALGDPEHGRQSVGPVPRGVYRTATLPTPPSDALWEHLVADARRTFSAQGKTSTVGRIREWRNGNLRVTLEPAGDGSRLHLQTRKNLNVESVSAALVLLLAGLVVAFTGSLDVAFDPESVRTGLMVAAVAAVGGAGLWTSTRSWASEREEQMAAVVQRAAEFVEPVVASPVASARARRIDASLLDDEPETEEGSAVPGRQRTR